MNQTESFMQVLMKFIDAHLDLHGYIDNKTLTAQFCMHRTRATSALTAYRKHCPDNTMFDVTSKRHVKTERFTRFFLDSGSAEYLKSVSVVFDNPAYSNDKA